MGTFEYGSPQYACTVEDRVLMHLQIVIIDKLRHGEQFTFRCDDLARPGAPETFWMSPHIPVRFVYASSGRPQINRAWLGALARSALTVDGLHVVDEPSSDRSIDVGGAIETPVLV